MQPTDYRNPPAQWLRGIDIHTLLPQQEPFVMVGCLEHFSMDRVVTSTEISPDNIFVDNGRMSASGLIENIAQTCAARIGYINTYINLKGIDIGFIGAIRNMTVNDLPPVGARIVTDVEILEDVFGVSLAKATVTTGDITLVTTDIKIAIKEE